MFGRRRDPENPEDVVEADRGRGPARDERSAVRHRKRASCVLEFGVCCAHRSPSVASPLGARPRPGGAGSRRPPRREPTNGLEE